MVRNPTKPKHELCGDAKFFSGLISDFSFNILSKYSERLKNKGFIDKGMDKQYSKLVNDLHSYKNQIEKKTRDKC